MGKLTKWILLLSILLTACNSRKLQADTVVSGEFYEMTFYSPAHWEKKLTEWDEMLSPGKGNRFLWVYIVMKSVNKQPIELNFDDYQLSYTLNDTERYTTTLAATGNNSTFLAVDEVRDYGGFTDEDGHGRKYVFSVPIGADDFVLKIESLPAVHLITP